MKSFIIIALCIVAVSCKQRPSTATFDAPVELVDFRNLREVSVKSPLDSIFPSREFVKIQMDTVAGLFRSITRLKVRSGRIFILDSRLRSLVAYDFLGKFLGKVGKRGNGTDEYLQISDFDIDADGKVIILDGQSDKICKYDSQFNFVSAQKLPFEADIVTILRDGKYIFGLSSWNKFRNAGDKIAVTDKHLTVMCNYLQYGEFRDDNYWISSYRFTDVAGKLFYNKPVDNSVHVFTKDGKPFKLYQFDFADMNVPDEDKKDIQANYSKFSNYRLLTNFAIVTDNYIIGTLRDRGKSRIFTIDKNKREVYLADTILRSTLGKLAEFNDNMITSYIHPTEVESFSYLPADVSDHLKNGQFVVEIQKVR